ncbi:mechanosensitive ion channel family protein [Synechococcus sp. CB0101]|uniref:mechanosensitive ion channel family protein n=1 Tax=Synechococcus sp. CB0101 TaxID=232348 RepID=UPI0002001F94|nr:mechanosensitive ion channel family protein [Synechococcus sp. CB0101]QCH15775.1 mechanosensitive ion channel family protein [Synechococcus sp. CB0101]
MSGARQRLLNDVDFFQSNEGLLVGTGLLIALWLLLKLVERYGRRVRPLVPQLAATLKRPLITGLSAALYLGWLAHAISGAAPALMPLKGLETSTALTLIAVGWATINLGQTLLRTDHVQRWLGVDDPRDRAMVTSLLDRLLSIGVVVLTVAALMVTFGVSTTAVATMLGGAGIGIGFGTQQVSQNFLSGLMLYFNRPFSVGDWIQLPIWSGVETSTLQGTVERIGWYHTRIVTLDRRPLSIPNSVFATTPIENPGRMYNRQIKASISLRYEDLPRIEAIAEAVNELLHNHPDIDSKQMILVSFNEWASSSINLLVYCFTRTTVWSEYLAVQQKIFLEIAKIVQEAGGDFAFNCTTLYPAPDLGNNHPIRSLTAS